MSKKCYILIQKEFMNTGIIGVYTEKHVAEQIAERLKNVLKKYSPFNVFSYEILECGLDSFDFINDAKEILEDEFKDLMKGGE